MDSFDPLPACRMPYDIVGKVLSLCLKGSQSEDSDFPKNVENVCSDLWTIRCYFFPQIWHLCLIVSSAICMIKIWHVRFFEE